MKKILFALLALCLVLTFSGCGGGGGGSDDDNGGGNGGNGYGGGNNSGTIIYICTNLVNDTGISGITQIEGGIRYTVTASSEIHEDTVKLTVNTNDSTFRIDQKLVNVTTSTIYSDVIYTGTFTKSGNTINAIITMTHDNQTSTDTPGSQPETFTINGNTTTGDGWEWIFTQQ